MTTDDRADELTALLTEAAGLAAEAAEAGARGDVAAVLRLDEQAERLRRRARARARSMNPTPLLQQRAEGEAADVSGSRGPASSARELTISALSELAVASSPRAVADYVMARFGTEIDPRGLAALRRDEQRSWASPRTQRPVYIVPALEGQRFLPLRGKIGLSAWPLEDRLVGPWSERVDHLRATISVARVARWISEARPERSEPIMALLARYAATVAAGTGVDPTSVEEAATAELAAMRRR